ncbi:MAG TPA: HD domain-containing protein [Thermoleophilaceae bacterium]
MRSTRTRAALAFADRHHAGQRREVDGAPFVTHPIEVARMLERAGYPDEVVAAGVLHDVLEDTDATREELTDEFGETVAELVDSVTDDPSIEDHRERKAALRRQVADAGPDALAIYAADKVSKARELRMRASRGPIDEAGREKLDHYDRSLELLEQRLGDQPLVDQLREELEAIHALSA